VTIRQADLDRFIGRLRARIAAGGATYGDSSVQRPAAELVDEIQRELEDVCGWALILWVRLKRLRERLADGGAEGGAHGRA
jgi:hypothetical protein